MRRIPRVNTLPGGGPLASELVRRDHEVATCIGNIVDVAEAAGLEQFPSRAARANKYLSFDSNGDPTATSPSEGTAEALAASLLAASDTEGAEIVGFIQAGTGAVARTAQDKMREPVSVKDFGAVGDGSTDDATAIGTAITAAVAAGAELVFPAGTYAFSTTLAFGYQDLRVRALGPVTLKHTGTGNAITFDGGTVGVGPFGTRFIGFTIEGNANTTNAIYVRAAHHLVIDARVTKACTTALRTHWSVLSEFRITCSNNEVAFTTVPTYGLYLDQRDTNEQTAYCTFINPIIEGTVNGAALAGAIGNVFINGAFEGCSNTGMHFAAGAENNRLFGTDFEVNTVEDILMDGGSRWNELYSVDTADLILIDGAHNNKIIGGLHETIQVDSGTNNQFLGASYNKAGSGSIGSSVPIVKLECYDLTNETFDQNEIIYELAAHSTPSVGASPYTYTNSARYPVEVFVLGGTVSSVTFKRGALELLKASATTASVLLDPGDECVVTYSSAPTVTVVPRG